MSDDASPYLTMPPRCRTEAALAVARKALQQVRDATTGYVCAAAEAALRDISTILGEDRK